MQQVRFANTVGVAPGTTTMTLGANSPAMAAAQLAATRIRSQYMPYPTMADMNGGLGVVFPESGGGWMKTGVVGRVYDQNNQPQPWATQAPTKPLSLKWNTSAGLPLPPAPTYGSVQIAGSATGSGLGYINRDWWQTGRTRGDATQGGYNYPTNLQPLSGCLGFTPGPERGYVNRTLIGAGLAEAGAQAVFIESPNAPNDAELSRVYQYMPVHAGWKYVTASQGVVGPGLGATDAAVAAEAASTASPSVAAEIANTQKRQFHLQVIATVAMATMAAIGVASYLRR
jgi:hypothetical protein